MANDNKEIGEIVKKCKILLLDIEGTTTSISFVKEKLFPYAEENVKQFLDSQWETDDVKEAVAALRKLALEDQKKSVDGVVVIPGEDATKDDQIEGLVKNVKWQMSSDRKEGALKHLQGLIWKQGYESGDIKGHVYDDVSPALEQWRSVDGQKVYIYSSGSVQAQKLLFGQSLAGDLLRFIDGHFDTAVGAKQEATSYTAIAEKIGVQPADVLFLTDIPKEAEAARGAGFHVALVSREGNAPLPTEATDVYAVLHSLAQLTATNKRKTEPQDEQPAKVPKTDADVDVKSTGESIVVDEKVTEKDVQNNEEKMEVEESPLVADGAVNNEKVGETVIEDVTDTIVPLDIPMADVEPVITEVDEKSEADKKTEEMESEVVESIAPVEGDTKPKEAADIPEVSKTEAVPNEPVNPDEVVTKSNEQVSEPDVVEIKSSEVVTKADAEIKSKVGEVTQADDALKSNEISSPNETKETALQAKSIENGSKTIEENSVDSKDQIEIQVVKEKAKEAEETPPVMVTEIEEITTENLGDVAEMMDDLEPIVEEPPNEDMEDLQNVGEVLEKECDEILSKVQDVTNLDNIPLKPLLNPIAEETMETEIDAENMDSNDIVDTILDKELELEMKQRNDVELNTVAEITDNAKIEESAEAKTTGPTEIELETNAKHDDKVTGNVEISSASQNMECSQQETKSDNDTKNIEKVEINDKKDSSGKEEDIGKGINKVDNSDDVGNTENAVSNDKIVCSEKADVKDKLDKKDETQDNEQNQEKMDTNVNSKDLSEKTDNSEHTDKKEPDNKVEATQAVKTEESKTENKMDDVKIQAETKDAEMVTEEITTDSEKDKESQVNGKATNGDAESVNVNGNVSNAEELKSRLSVENGKEPVNGSNGDSTVSEEGQGDKVEAEVSDIKVKTVATEEPRTDPIERPTEA